MGLIIPSEIQQEEYENSRGITKETSNKVIRNKIQFEDNCVSSAKINNNIKKQKIKLYLLVSFYAKLQKSSE